MDPIQDNPILECIELTQPWVGIDPFLVCAHHVEHYPAGDEHYAVPESHRVGHPAGSDFGNPDGYSLYSGADGMPGFPNHPHRGMETVSILQKGYVDHADSLGNSGRYGPGDVQWMTAGGGIQHAEMFPLLSQDQPNEFELFQVWLNMPGRKKMVHPEYKMMWDAHIPHYQHGGADVKIIAGTYQPQEPEQSADGFAPVSIQPIVPTLDTWAADPRSEVAIWMITLEPGARQTLPAAQLAQTQRTLYVYTGIGLLVDGQDVGGNKRVRVLAQAALPLANRSAHTVRLMLLQGVPLNEPVVRSTVYVTNTIEELHQAKRDFQRTQFGGWPWETRQPMHGPGYERFARYMGRSDVEKP
ncbi:pirin family protein [Comamonas sp. Y33R10-2]|nr:pirin family protein [Comamonas sp. Y33R10-2]